MKLAHIELGKLSVSAANMRHGRKAPDVSDILPTVRARGVLVPLLVRPRRDDFEIVAGRRRYHAARTVADEQRASGARSGTGCPSGWPFRRRPMRHGRFRPSIAGVRCKRW